MVLIVAVSGACRRDELTKLSINDVNDSGSSVQIAINDTTLEKQREFLITETRFGKAKSLEIVRKYMSLRNGKNDRFFVNYRSGKCTSQPVGVNTIGAMPKKIAKYLNIPDCEQYTGLCFRHTSATLVADTGADLSVLKRHRASKSSTVAESYVDRSVGNKCKIAERILEPNVTSNANGASTATCASCSVSKIIMHSTCWQCRTIIARVR